MDCKNTWIYKYTVLTAGLKFLSYDSIQNFYGPTEFDCKKFECIMYKILSFCLFFLKERSQMGQWKLVQANKRWSSDLISWFFKTYFLYFFNFIWSDKMIKKYFFYRTFKIFFYMCFDFFQQKEVMNAQVKRNNESSTSWSSYLIKSTDLIIWFFFEKIFFIFFKFKMIILSDKIQVLVWFGKKWKIYSFWNMSSIFLVWLV